MYQRIRKGGVPEQVLEGLYERLGSARVLFLYGTITGMKDGPRMDPFAPHYIADSLLAMGHESSDPIWLTVDTPGGDVNSGMVLYDAMQLCPAPIYTLGRNSMSMGAIILAGGEPGHRYVYPHARTMLHQPEAAMQGDVSKMQIMYDEMDRIYDTLIATIINNGCGRSELEIKEDLRHERWMNGQETIDYGLADNLITQKDLYNRPVSELEAK
tara:strand:- start:4287 stop:4925 length:639 start_codon:yes stop_codon:yes gene_type:complete